MFQPVECDTSGLESAMNVKTLFYGRIGSNFVFGFDPGESGSRGVAVTDRKNGQVVVNVENMREMVCMLDAATKPGDGLQKKMQDLMYFLTKEAARHSFRGFLESCGVSEEDYDKIKSIWSEKLGVVPYL